MAFLTCAVFLFFFTSIKSFFFHTICFFVLFVVVVVVILFSFKFWKQKLTCCENPWKQQIQVNSSQPPRNYDWIFQHLICHIGSLPFFKTMLSLESVVGIFYWRWQARIVVCSFLFSFSLWWTSWCRNCSCKHFKKLSKVFLSVVRVWVLTTIYRYFWGHKCLCVVEG